MRPPQQQLIDTDRSFSRYSVKHGAAAAFRHYLIEKSVQLPNRSLPIKGRQSIAAAMEQDSDILLSWEPESGDIAQSQDLGYTWGNYTVTSQNGSKVILTGKYLNIWRKQPNGTWKVEVDMGNLNPED